MSHILIVDQILHRRKVHHRLIKMIEPDIKVEEFDEPHEALDWIQTHSTDLMVLAMQMRGMDASYFISTLQKSHPSLCPPSLVLSQDEDRIMRLRAFETGAVDHMSIPVDPDEFILRTRRLLSLHHHVKRLTIRVQELEKELELLAAALNARDKREIQKCLMRMVEDYDPEPISVIEKTKEIVVDGIATIH